MRKLALTVAVMLGGCVHANSAALAVSTAALVCDGMQTLRMAGEGWTRTSEANPVMGPAPGVSEVGAYFVGAVVINAAVWVAMPKRWRTVVPMAVTAVQIDVIRNNIGQGTGMCGL